MKARLTKSYIDGLKPENKAYRAWDSLITGLYVRVTPSGKKTFYYQYRLKTGKIREPSIGDFSTMTIEEARGAAADIDTIVRKGKDPSLEMAKNVEELKREERQSRTLDELYKRYMSDHSLVHKKAKSQGNDKTAWEKHILPRLGKNTKIKNISKADVIEMHTEIGKEHPTNANRVYEILRKGFNLAQDWEWLPKGESPCTGITKFREKKRKRYLSPEEVIRLGKVLQKYEEEDHEFKRKTAWLVWLLIFTGARLREILHAKWEWIEWTRSVLLLPDTKSNEEQELQLPEVALVILKKMQTMRKYPNNPYIFSGKRHGKPMADEGEYWQDIKTEANLSDFRIHDLRHSFASVSIMETGNLAMLGGILRHADAKTTQRYAHLMNDPLLAATNSAASHIYALMNKDDGKEPPPEESNVISIEDAKIRMMG